MNKRYLLKKLIFVPLVCISIMFPSLIGERTRPSDVASLTRRALTSDIASLNQIGVAEVRASETVQIETTVVRVPSQELSSQTFTSERAMASPNTRVAGASTIAPPVVPAGQTPSTWQLSNFWDFRLEMESIFGVRRSSNSISGELYTVASMNRRTMQWEEISAVGAHYRAVVGRPRFQTQIDLYREAMGQAVLQTFPDLSPGDWFLPFIALPVYYGVISGIPNAAGVNEFRGNDPVTREQAATMWAIANQAQAGIVLDSIDHGWGRHAAMEFGLAEWANVFWQHPVNRAGLLDIHRLGHSGSHLYSANMTRAEFAYLIANHLWDDAVLEVLRSNPGPGSTNFWDITNVLTAAAINSDANAHIPLAKMYLDAMGNGQIPAPYLAAIIVLVEKNVMSGFPDGSSGFNQPLTRAQALVLIENAIRVWGEGMTSIR